MYERISSSYCEKVLELNQSYKLVNVYRRDKIEAVQ